MAKSKTSKTSESKTSDITVDRDLKAVRVGDFVTFTYGGDDEGPLWFSVEGPGTSLRSHVGVERQGQFMVQQYGDFKVGFSNGEKDLSTQKFTVKEPEEA